MKRSFPPRLILSLISKAKDKLQQPDEFAAQAAVSRGLPSGKDRRGLRGLCPSGCKAASAVDFDDIILLTVQLLQQYQDVRDYYQREIPLCHDRRIPGYEPPAISPGLPSDAGGGENICVVGDDDQSIYRFRGATIENILNFEQQFPKARASSGWSRITARPSPFWTRPTPSSPTTTGRKGKKLWTKNEPGDRVTHL